MPSTQHFLALGSPLDAFTCAFYFSFRNNVLCSLHIKEFHHCILHAFASSILRSCTTTSLLCPPGQFFLLLALPWCSLWVQVGKFTPKLFCGTSPQQCCVYTNLHPCHSHPTDGTTVAFSGNASATMEATGTWPFTWQDCGIDVNVVYGVHVVAHDMWDPPNVGMV